jgi:adenylate cyclase
MLNSLIHSVLQKKEKIVRLFFGLILVFGITSLLFVEVEPIASWVSLLEDLSYDMEVRQMHKPLGKDTSIVIVDIDDESLKAEGRWPWPRKRCAELVSNLYEKGAVVIGFDITFPDPEENLVDEVIQADPNLNQQLQGVRKSFDYDSLFASSLAKGDSVLAMVMENNGENSGTLPTPLMQLTPEMVGQLSIPNKPDYLASIPILASAAKTQGFINTTPDPDGVLRFTPLIFRQGNALYGSMALQAVSLFLLTQKVELVTPKYQGKPILEGIKLDALYIPTDPMGRMLIPFRGPPYTFPYVSALDVLNNNKVPKEAIEGKLVLVGTTASAIGDTRPAAIAPIFPGIEIHASVAAGILDHYLPFKPTWGRGVTLLLMLSLGSLFAIILPFYGLLSMCIFCSVVPLILIGINYWIWTSLGIVISIFLPVGLILLLFVMNTVWGYLFETKRSKEMKSMFGQYVPPAYLEEMIKKGGSFGLEGESKELSVLFADIRSFTSLSEKMTASELKQFLNRYFTPITEIIFLHKGTIDKYVGDMVMAFWGAPLADSTHAYNAVSTALAMQAGLAKINVEFLAEKKPEIRIGVGVNSGMMNVGDMGSKFRRSYTVLGDTVNLASRLEGQTKFYHIGILVGEDTYGHTKDRFAYRHIDKIKVKGKETGVDVYSPICPIEDMTPELSRELDTHHKALEAYFQKRWDEAERLFQQNISANKELSEVYLERIAQMRTSPPGPNWDGAYVSHEK